MKYILLIIGLCFSISVSSQELRGDLLINPYTENYEFIESINNSVDYEIEWSKKYAYQWEGY